MQCNSEWSDFPGLIIECIFTIPPSYCHLGRFETLHHQQQIRLRIQAMAPLPPRMLNAPLTLQSKDEDESLYFLQPCAMMTSDAPDFRLLPPSRVLDNLIIGALPSAVRSTEAFIRKLYPYANASYETPFTSWTWRHDTSSESSIEPYQNKLRKHETRLHNDDQKFQMMIVRIVTFRRSYKKEDTCGFREEEQNKIVKNTYISSCPSHPVVDVRYKTTYKPFTDTK